MGLRTLSPSLKAADLRSIKPPAKVGAPIYSSPEWIALRNRVRREAGGRCQRPGCNRPGHTVDHKVELSDGGAPFDNSTLWSTV